MHLSMFLVFLFVGGHEGKIYYCYYINIHDALKAKMYSHLTDCNNVFAQLRGCVILY